MNGLNRARRGMRADLRAHDAACLTDPAVAELLDRHGVRHISYRKLRELRRGR